MRRCLAVGSIDDVLPEAIGGGGVEGASAEEGEGGEGLQRACTSEVGALGEIGSRSGGQAGEDRVERSRWDQVEIG